jgi:Ca2+-transporting ATPase
VDKTGTLTQNRMAVRRLWVPGSELDLQPTRTRFAGPRRIESPASEREPFDPMEKAYHRLAQERAPAAVEKLGSWTLAHSYP